ncbi:hypothetical protein EFK50_07840 [Nocardioides marmoriginsengisoli]|uniref:Uncharacterized protein n=2 Tax=Nocardioides marmoriginsengisoli TaxID=661483 RepID=A0A3N0CJM4_9ACTN|nr:hypothetical protein EFK50_07840 [Nocardioides marmoriginsengisoli]
MTLTLTPQAPMDPPSFTTDPDGFEVPAFNTQSPHAGKVQSGTQAGSDTPTRYVKVAGVDRPVLAAGLHIPVGAPIPVASEQRGQATEYVVSGLGQADDPALLNRRYMVVGVPAKSFATARRLDVIQL